MDSSAFVVVGVIMICIVLLVRFFPRYYRQWQISRLPLQTVEATVIAKRTGVAGGYDGAAVYSTYFVTFRLPDGQRLEFQVEGETYGRVVEEDRGKLSYKDKFFVKFERYS